MTLTRRAALIGLTAVLARPAWAKPSFDAWLRGFRKRARTAGISSAILDRALAGLSPVSGALKLDRRQTEVARSLQEYVASAASSQRIQTGRAKLKKHARTFAAIEKRFGVPAEVIIAIWGMESSFGGFRGNTPVIATLATLAHDGRRADLFERELIAALNILQSGDTTAARMVGSLAGAMGHTQFMPSSFLKHAVDWTGDGRRDIWSDDPTDALASTAAYLKTKGWVKGQPWAIEVALPKGMDLALTGRIFPRRTRDWIRLGVTAASGGKLPNHGKGAVILPAGPTGPVFMIYQNFHVLKAYNYADSYVIGVGHLSDRLAGGGPIRAGYPQNPWGMTNAQRQTLQKRLNARGFKAGNPDGVIGEKGRAAIRAYETSAGLDVTGVPTLALLDRLR
ncbi:lytic murein transglycosylase [Aliiroseovarius subalbicans]|uniref:lytic murein transglycosylase n=1 Tax=Aliiroseovarius subalbicans TaxID=2925840 RepID=UPI001F5A2D02|nr:lytic murein transglycosylase [Aliiroseovarius subalbicans]MCI2399547.1 lytic murein transglycosylase [Aliiroseovarius subalbicans]